MSQIEISPEVKIELNQLEANVLYSEAAFIDAQLKLKKFYDEHGFTKQEQESTDESV
ncbi:hypothetical protein ABDC18_002857 [Escherichia coli]